MPAAQRCSQRPRDAFSHQRRVPAAGEQRRRQGLGDVGFTTHRITSRGVRQRAPTSLVMHAPSCAEAQRCACDAVPKHRGVPGVAPGRPRGTRRCGPTGSTARCRTPRRLACGPHGNPVAGSDARHRSLEQISGGSWPSGHATRRRVAGNGAVGGFGALRRYLAVGAPAPERIDAPGSAIGLGAWRPLSAWAAGAE